MSIAKNIQYVVKQRMKALDISIPDLEAKAGVKRNVLGNFISGTRNNPTLETLSRIADVLECSVVDLFTPSPQNNEILQSQKNPEFLKWNEELFNSCINIVIKIINEYSEKSPIFKKKTLDTNKIIFIITQVYKFTIKENHGSVVANEKFAEFLIENNFPSL